MDKQVGGWQVGMQDGRWEVGGSQVGKFVEWYMGRRQIVKQVSKLIGR